MRIICLLIVMLTFSANAQQDAWIYFNSKPDAQFYFDNPLLMLTQRSLDRRVNQGIALDIKDVPISQSYISTVDAVFGITVMAKSKWLNAVHVRGQASTINSLAALPFVSEIDFADNSLDASGRTIVSNQSAVQQNALADFQYGQSANQIQMLNGHLLHQQDYTGSGKIIAVLDAGFPEVDVVQPFARLRNNNLILGGYNYVDRNNDIYSRNSHGTLVLSTMGGYTENQLVGTAPDASYYLFITEDIFSENPVEESYWVEAAEAADSLGVDIINSSLGYFTYDNPAYNYSYADMNGVTSFVSRGADIAFSRGMIVVVSAGNSGNSSEPHISVPADAINALTVGAVTATGNYAGFSSIGPTSDGRIKPDVVARGQSAVVANTLGNITTASGTSISGPIIAGMVASLWQALPTFTNSQIVDLIKQSAHIYQNPTFQLGYGIPDFQLALSSGLLSVNEVLAEDFQIYPNPVGQTLNFNTNQNYFDRISVYDTGGRILLNRNVSQGEGISVDFLPSGLYFYKFTGAGQTKSGKFVKQ